jgi:adenosylcobinamide-GDP ribazoletransferase
MTGPTSGTSTVRRGWLATCWLRFALAVTFLTRLPLPVGGGASPADLRASMGWYPLIGLGIGAAGWGLYAASRHLLPGLVAAALVVALLEVFTGVLHLDGLMDTCDGIGSGAPRERALEIMKDSRSGAMGVFGAVAVMLLKVTALGSLTAAQSMTPLLVGWAAARTLPIWDVVLFRYARPAGTGGAFAAGRAPWAPAFATLSMLAIAFLMGHLAGLALGVGVVAVTLLVQAGIARRLGGLTGDVYGMGIELAETLALVAAAALA